MPSTSLTSPQPSAAEWARIVDESTKTTLSLRAFSTQVGVPLQQLYDWRSKLKAAKPRPRRQRGFKEVTPKLAVTPRMTPQHGTIELHLRNGNMVRVTEGRVDATLLQTVITLAKDGAAC